MKVAMTEPFVKAFLKLPQATQKLFGKQLALLLTDLRHPSLDAKVYDGRQRLWQARVDRGYRFYFTLETDTLVLHGIGPHPK